MSGQRDLQSRRLEAVRAWTSFVENGDPSAVRPEIRRSWELSGATITPDVTEAPLADEGETAAYFQGSPLQTAVDRVESDLRRTAEDGDLVLAITDAETRILWTYGGRVMRRKAETVNFVPAGRWDEASVGTNALAIAARTGRKTDRVRQGLAVAKLPAEVVNSTRSSKAASTLPPVLRALTVIVVVERPSLAMR